VLLQWDAFSASKWVPPAATTARWHT
jgi:hypothetical protein